MNGELPEYPDFLGSELPSTTPEQALFHILPVPYEKTVSYGSGTAQGPSAILQASWQLETWDGTSYPSNAGIYTHSPIDCKAPAETVIRNIASKTASICALGKIPVAIGGEHTVTYGVIKGLIEAGFNDIGVVQIDAHADLRDTYLGDKHSHACVMRRIVDCNIPVYQLGVRALSEEESIARQQYNVLYQDASSLVPQSIQKIILPDDFPQQVFFTLDIDGMDPSVFPSTGTPVPGGLDWYQTLNIFESIARQRKIIGFDLMEFAPITGFHAYDYAAAELIYKLIGIAGRSISP